MSSKIITIKKPQDFKRIGKTGDAFYSKNLVLLVDQDQDLGDQEVRVGYTVSKKVSKLAVTRNLAKRRLREAFRLTHKEKPLPSARYILIAKKNITNSTYQEILRDLKYCLRKSKAS